MLTLLPEEKNMNTIDTRGLSCPAPLIATKKALKDSKEGETFTVLTDNVTSLNNITRFLKDNMIGFSTSEKQGTYTLTVLPGSGELNKPDAEEYCTAEVPHFSKGSFVVAFGSDTMGEGDRDLGLLLMGNFIKALKDLDVLPSKLVFYNKGVLLGCRESAVAEHLGELEKMGVALYFCATCVNHYRVNDQISAGILSNMFEIAQIMATASSVIKP